MSSTIVGPGGVEVGEKMEKRAGRSIGGQAGGAAVRVWVEEGDGGEEQEGKMAKDGRWTRDGRGRGWLK